MRENLAEIKNLHVEYKTDKGIFGGVQTIYAVNGVDLEIKKGEMIPVTEKFQKKSPDDFPKPIFKP